MAVRDYKDFVLVADNVEKDGNSVKKFTVSVFDSPVGQGEYKETVTVPGNMDEQLDWLERRRFDEETSEQIKTGEMLADILLPSYARKLFGESLKRLQNGEGLRLRLRLADELADFPWEYMYIQDSRGERRSDNFLMLDPRISIVRHEAIAIPGDWFETPASRRMVIAMASPQPFDRYPKLAYLPEEHQALKESLTDIKGLDTIYIPEFEPGQTDNFQGVTLKQLMGALMTRTDIFHFSGHGEFTWTVPGSSGEGGLVLCDEENKAFPVSAERFAAEMLRGKGIRLVVLGACKTGRRDGRNVWSSIATSVLKAGIPAVVAMQYEIQDRLASAFCGTFYRSLVAGLLIDEAVALGRIAIRAEALKAGKPDIRDWGVPVLYMRASGGRVFNPVSDDTACREAEQDLNSTVRQHVREIAPEGRVIGAVVGTMQGRQTIEVDQRANEKVSGIMIGSSVYHLQGGCLVVRQEADVVDGTMIGASIGSLGGNIQDADPEEKALSQLKKLLSMKQGSLGSSEDYGIKTGPPKMSCPKCHNPIKAGWKFCPGCNTNLSSASKFCAECATKLAFSAKFCTHCGAKTE